MKRKLMIITGSVIAVLLLATFIAPHFILMADKQEEVAAEYAYGEMTEGNYRSALKAKEILDGILSVSHELDKYIQAK